MNTHFEPVVAAASFAPFGADAGAAWAMLADAAVKGAILLTAAWIATLALRRSSSAAVRHVVWVLAVGGVLALPLLSTLLPRWRVLPAWVGRASVATTPVAVPPDRLAPGSFAVEPRSTTAVPPSGPPDRSPIPSAGAPAGRPASAIPVVANVPHTAATPVAIPSASTHAPATPLPPPWWRQIGWQGWVLAAWASGATIMMLPVIVSFWGLWRLGRRTPRIESGPWADLLRDCAARLRVRHPVTLLRADRPDAMPMTWGLLSPRLLVPPEADGWSHDRCRVVLMHELAHVKRADFATQLLVHLARAIYWFNPLIWIAARRVAVESEQACDDLVLAQQETRASDYAEHLLSVAARLRGSALTLPAAAVAMARSARLEGRLRAILDSGRNRRPLSVAGVVIATMLLAAGLLPLAMARAASVRATPARPAARDWGARASADAGASNAPIVITAKGDSVIVEHAGATITANRIEIRAPDAATISGAPAGWAEWLAVRNWSWVEKDPAAAPPANQPWDALFREARRVEREDTELGQGAYLRQLQQALDATPPRAGELEIRLAMGDAMVLNFSHRMPDQAAAWYAQTIERFKDLAPSTGTMLAKLRLAELLGGQNREAHRELVTRLLSEVLDTPDADVLVTDDGRFLTLAEARLAKYSAAERKRMADAGAPAENLDQLDRQYADKLVRDRADRISQLHAAAADILVRGQWGADGWAKTRDRLLMLRKFRPQDKVFQDALAAYLLVVEKRAKDEAAKGKDAGAAAALPAGVIAEATIPLAEDLTGVVTDEAGKPVADALVDVWSWCPGNETKTDAKGAFHLKKLGDEPVEIRISKEGLCPWYRAVQPLGVHLQIRLTNKTYFEGIVKSPDGKPVADALVRGDSGPKSNPTVEITTVWTETHSDANGRYKLYVAPDNYALQVRVPKVGAARLPKTAIADGQAKTVDITLAAGATFQAVVVDSQSGAPVPGVRLSHWEHKGVEGVSDMDGKIAIDGMATGPFTFNIAAKGYSRWWSAEATERHHKLELREGRLQRNFDDLTFNVAAEMKPVKIELERAVRITGIVQDPDGNPVAGATVAPADGDGNSLTGDTRYSVPTDKDGKFTVELPASGKVKYNLTAHDGAYGQWRKWANGIVPPIQTKPGDELKDVVIKLTRPAIVRGHAKDENGKPLANRDIRASAADRMENRYYDPTTKTDKNGDFELRFIRPGEQFIQVAPFFWTNVPEGGMTLKLKEGETNSLGVTLKPGETRAGVELTGPASTAFPSHEEQLRRILEKMEREKEKPADPKPLPTPAPPAGAGAGVAAPPGAGAPAGGPAPAAVADAKRKQMKGWELYIWRQDEKTNFALMPGTNRLKSPEEIHAAGEAGIDRVKAKLKELAEGEFVSIMGPTRQDAPPKEAADELAAFGKELGLKINGTNR